VNPFAFLAIYFAVAILDQKEEAGEQIVVTEDTPNETADEAQLTTSGVQFPSLKSLLTNHLFLYSLGFGFAYGMALASKVNIYPLAVLLPGAFALRYFINHKDQSDVAADDGDSNKSANYWLLITAFLLAGGLAALISFRIFQPYAFDGLMPSQQWISNIQEQRAQAKGDADLPGSQWARRSHLYSFVNLTVWGLGLPLGILAWLGFILMAWRIFKGEWRHALLWGWTAAYFIWQSMQFNPTMRYQLPIYPLLVMMAAWFVLSWQITNRTLAIRFRYAINSLHWVQLSSATAAAFAFQSIYVRDEPRMAASRWIFQNIPGPITLEIQQADGSTYNRPLPFPRACIFSRRSLIKLPLSLKMMGCSRK
jgi:hypothetical protein